MYFIQHCFICRPSDSTVSVDAGIEPRTVATALADRRSVQLARSHPLIKNFAFTKNKVKDVYHHMFFFLVNTSTVNIFLN
jgi:hypothetical protein